MVVKDNSHLRGHHTRAGSRIGHSLRRGRRQLRREYVGFMHYGSMTSGRG